MYICSYWYNIHMYKITDFILYITSPFPTQEVNPMLH